MRSPVIADGSVAGSALAGQTQIRERNHANGTLESFAISRNRRVRASRLFKDDDKVRTARESKIRDANFDLASSLLGY